METFSCFMSFPEAPTMSSHKTIVSGLPVRALAPHAPQAPRTLGHGLRASCRSLFSGCSPPSCCPFWGVALVQVHPAQEAPWGLDDAESPGSTGSAKAHCAEGFSPGPSTCLPSRQTSPQKPSASDSGEPRLRPAISSLCVVLLAPQLQPLI